MYILRNMNVTCDKIRWVSVTIDAAISTRINERSKGYDVGLMTS